MVYRLVNKRYISVRYVVALSMIEKSQRRWFCGLTRETRSDLIDSGQDVCDVAFCKTQTENDLVL